MATQEDDEWVPPSEAELKIIRARRERSDKITQLMGTYLLKGYTMLGNLCPDCQTILLRDKHGKNYCVACCELDSDADKDNPALSTSAARRQVEEERSRDPRLLQNATAQNGATSLVSNLSQSANRMAASPLVAPPQATPSAPVISFPVSESGDSRPLQSSSAVSIVENKLQWATVELVRCSTVEGCIQLCLLIKSCAETLIALRTLEGQSQDQ